MVNDITTLSNRLYEVFQLNYEINYKLSESSSLVFKIERLSKLHVRLRQCIYSAELLEFGKDSLEFYICNGIDNVAILLYSFRQEIKIADIYGDLIYPTSNKILYRGELTIKP